MNRNWIKRVCLFTVACSGIFLFSISLAHGQSDVVKLEYEFWLSQCKVDSCNDEKIQTGELAIQLEEEDSSYAWGYTAVDLWANETAYQLRFKASRKKREELVSTSLFLHFSGRSDSDGGPQVTWTQGQFTEGAWDQFAPVEVKGNQYLERGFNVTPILRVKVVR